MIALSLAFVVVLFSMVTSPLLSRVLIVVAVALAAFGMAIVFGEIA